MFGAPFAGDVKDNPAHFIRRRPRQAELRGERQQFLGHLQPISDEDDGDVILGAGERNVLQMAHMERILQVWMEIQQDEKGIGTRCFYVIQNVRKLLIACGGF